MQIQITIGIFFYNPNKVWYKLIFSAKNSYIIFKFVALYIKNSYSYIGVSITKSKNSFVYYIKLRFICQVILLKFPKKTDTQISLGVLCFSTLSYFYYPILSNISLS